MPRKSQHPNELADLLDYFLDRAGRDRHEFRRAVGLANSTFIDLRQRQGSVARNVTPEAIRAWAKVLELTPDEEQLLLVVAQALYAPPELKTWVIERLGPQLTKRRR